MVADLVLQTEYDKYGAFINYYQTKRFSCNYQKAKIFYAFVKKTKELYHRLLDYYDRNKNSFL